MGKTQKSVKIKDFNSTTFKVTFSIMLYIYGVFGAVASLIHVGSILPNNVSLNFTVDGIDEIILLIVPLVFTYFVNDLYNFFINKEKEFIPISVIEFEKNFIKIVSTIAMLIIILFLFFPTISDFISSVYEFKFLFWLLVISIIIFIIVFHYILKFLFKYLSKTIHSKSSKENDISQNDINNYINKLNTKIKILEEDYDEILENKKKLECELEEERKKTQAIEN